LAKSLEPDGLLVLGYGGVVLALVVKGFTEAIVGLGEVGLEPNGFPVFGDGGIVLALLFKVVTQVVVSLGVVVDILSVRIETCHYCCDPDYDDWKQKWMFKRAAAKFDQRLGYLVQDRSPTERPPRWGDSYSCKERVTAQKLAYTTLFYHREGWSIFAWPKFHK